MITPITSFERTYKGVIVAEFEVVYRNLPGRNDLIYHQKFYFLPT